MTVEWVAFDGELAAGSKVHREIAKSGISANDLIRLGKLLDRVGDATAIAGSDYKYLNGEDLWEVVFNVDKRWFRLLYSPQKGRNVLVGLVFVQKQSNKLPRHVFKTAKARLHGWQADNK